jgi:hypothetical protein
MPHLLFCEGKVVVEGVRGGGVAVRFLVSVRIGGVDECWEDRV